MKRAAMRLSFVILLLAVAGCSGGGGGSSVHATGTTIVTIDLGQTKTVSSAGGAVRTAAAIPDAIDSIRITVSAPDMPTIERTVALAGTSSVSEKIEVSNGQNRLFTVEALDKEGYVLYRGAAYADLAGIPVKLGITMVSSDPLPPVFQGLSAISQITTTSLVLSWQAATDEVTSSDKIQYLIYMSTTPGGEDYGAPTFTTAPGETSFNVTGLNPDTKYYFVVRPMDEGGNIGANNFELWASTLTGADVSPAAFEGLASAVASSPSTADLGWNAASDNKSSSSDIVYLVYMSTTPGGENFASPTFETAPGATSYQVGGLSPNTTYYFVVRSRDEAGNVDSNVVERSVTTPVPPDATPPVFGGLTSARASGTTVTLSWRPASDSGGVAGYNIYMATSSGGENFTSPLATAGANATSINIAAPSGGTTYYFVVRARDAAGNVDGNFVERQATTDIFVNAVTGNDKTGSGTAVSPFLTISKALAVSAGKPGLTINTAAGVYDAKLGEIFPLNFAGTSGRTLNCPVAGCGFSPCIGGATITSAGSGQSAIFGGPNTTIKNCAITGDTTTAGIYHNGGNITVQNCTIDGRNATLNCVELGGTETLTGNKIMNCRQFGVVASLNGNPAITGNVIQNNGTGIQIWNTSYPVIQSNTITTNTTGISINSTGSPVIAGNSIYNNSAYGINLGSGNPKINGNRLYCNSGADLNIVSVSASIDATNNAWDHIPPSYQMPTCPPGLDICNFMPTFPPSLSGATLVPAPCP